MNDREKWREKVMDIRAGGTTWYIYIYSFDLFMYNHVSSEKRCNLKAMKLFPWHTSEIYWQLCVIKSLLSFHDLIISAKRKLTILLPPCFRVKKNIETGSFAANEKWRKMVGSKFVKREEATSVFSGGLKSIGRGDDKELLTSGVGVH